MDLILALLLIGSADKPKDKPTVSMRAAPRIADLPARIVFTVQLGGGEDSAALHCLTLAWDWGDGTRSRSEGDCSPFEPGRTAVQRLFQADHVYVSDGKRTAGVKVLKGKNVVGSASTGVAIYPRNRSKGGEFRGRD
jgi:hypothetical protein